VEAAAYGGILTFTTRLTDPNKVHDADWPEAGPGHYVELAASDTGCGMNSETMRHLFEPFFTTKPAGGGVGLGLSTVYGIITKAGGGITIDSDKDNGTTFHIYLPACTSSRPPTHSPATCATPSKRSAAPADLPTSVTDVGARFVDDNR
jgi:two-component system, cell cycle sensor histidine kinase and response regulator CckA